MEIMGKNLSLEQGAYIGNINDPKEAEASRKRASRTAGGDRVRLSSKIKVFQGAIKRIEDLPEIREVKVQQIKSALEAGTYKVDPDKIAGRVIKESFLNHSI
jgi:negative regulator of flagellin synthesis FlgM